MKKLGLWVPCQIQQAFRWLQQTKIDRDTSNWTQKIHSRKIKVLFIIAIIWCLRWFASCFRVLNFTTSLLLYGRRWCILFICDTRSVEHEWFYFQLWFFMGAESFHDSSCWPCTQTFSQTYTCKIGFAIWFFLDPLLYNLPHLNPCEYRALLLDWSHPCLLF